MVQVSSISVSALRQGLAVFLVPGPQRLEDSLTVVGWAKDHPENVVLRSSKGRNTILHRTETVYAPDSVILS